MKKYKLSNTDLEVSRIAYGTMHIGGSWDKDPISEESKKKASKLINSAVEYGINLIDLADIYTHGKSEEAVGYTFKENPSLRDKLVLQGKCGIILNDSHQPKEPARYDFSYKHILVSVETTLRRTGSECLDLLAFHRPDPLVEPEELARAVDHLHKSGKVRYFGVSNHNWAQIELLKKHIDQPLVVNQLELSLKHHHLISDGILTNTISENYSRSMGTLDYCRLHNIKIQAWSPLAGGELFKKSSPTYDLLSDLAKEYDCSQEAIALAWLLKHPAGFQPILGTMNDKRLKAVINADSIELKRTQWYQLLESVRCASVP